MSDTSETQYDVAISFLAKDEPLALRILDALEPVRVFVYSKEQEEVAGREGIEAFRNILRSDASLAVILFRSGWGKTPWTRVEEAAIRDLCLERGWDRLIFVRLESKTPVPAWVPDSYIYLDFERFGLSDLVGVVKAGLGRVGVQLNPLTPAERAARIAKAEQYDDETTSFLRLSSQPFHETAEGLFAEINRHCREMENATGWEISGGGNSREYFAVYCKGRTIQLLPEGVYANAADGAYLRARIFDGRLLTPEERGKYYALDELRELGSPLRLEIGRRSGSDWGWRTGEEFLTNRASAERILSLLLENIDRTR